MEMNVTVKLFGTLGDHLPGYDPDRGIDVDIPDGTRVKDLLAHLEIHRTKGVIVAANGKLLKPDEVIENGGSFQIFQSVFGG